jgi:hypothetical protein
MLAKDELSMAEIIGKFTRQAGDKKETRVINKEWRKYISRRKRLLESNTKSKEIGQKQERRKIDIENMDADEKQEYIKYLDSQGIRHA